ncbi:hypothetical protein PAPYR_447 [Paratrimastix pyriformis]|uniref:Uncharacterized protein n=1 Tax=Paratrimastix pyriformis TaxID=342808 RepID=A0ABQ8UVR0_9EUKA|nr:hypothetical protein PAPYR_447 [Paratrimastix pyriformis]
MSDVSFFDEPPKVQFLSYCFHDPTFLPLKAADTQPNPTPSAEFDQASFEPVELSPSPSFPDARTEDAFASSIKEIAPPTPPAPPPLDGGFDQASFEGAAVPTTQPGGSPLPLPGGPVPPPGPQIPPAVSGVFAPAPFPGDVEAHASPAAAAASALPAPQPAGLPPPPPPATTLTAPSAPSAARRTPSYATYFMQQQQEIAARQARESQQQQQQLSPLPTQPAALAEPQAPAQQQPRGQMSVPPLQLGGPPRVPAIRQPLSARGGPAMGSAGSPMGGEAASVDSASTEPSPRSEASPATTAHSAPFTVHAPRPLGGAMGGMHLPTPRGSGQPLHPATATATATATEHLTPRSGAPGALSAHRHSQSLVSLFPSDPEGQGQGQGQGQGPVTPRSATLPRTPRSPSAPSQPGFAPPPQGFPPQPQGPEWAPPAAGRPPWESGGAAPGPQGTGGAAAFAFGDETTTAASPRTSIPYQQQPGYGAWAQPPPTGQPPYGPAPGAWPPQAAPAQQQHTPREGYGTPPMPYVRPPVPASAPGAELGQPYGGPAPDGYPPRYGGPVQPRPGASAQYGRPYGPYGGQEPLAQSPRPGAPAQYGGPYGPYGGQEPLGQPPGGYGHPDMGQGPPRPQYPPTAQPQYPPAPPAPYGGPETSHYHGGPMPMPGGPMPMPGGASQWGADGSGPAYGGPYGGGPGAPGGAQPWEAGPMASPSPVQEPMPPRAHPHPLICFGHGGLMVTSFPRFIVYRQPAPPPPAFGADPWQQQQQQPQQPQLVRGPTAFPRPRIPSPPHSLAPAFPRPAFPRPAFPRPRIPSPPHSLAPAFPRPRIPSPPHSLAPSPPPRATRGGLPSSTACAPRFFPALLRSFTPPLFVPTTDLPRLAAHAERRLLRFEVQTHRLQQLVGHKAPFRALGLYPGPGSAKDALGFLKRVVPSLGGPGADESGGQARASEESDLVYSEGPTQHDSLHTLWALVRVLCE